MVTTTLFKIIQSELIKNGHSEFIDSENNLILFDKEFQFTEKILSYDDDIKEILSYIFHGLTLDDPEHDLHFKKMFLYRFVNREINRQTIEAFKMELMNTFITNKDYINRVYKDSDLFILQKNKSQSDNTQKNNQSNESSTMTDNRQAFADLPQSQANLDVNNTNISYATDNTISRNKQTTENQTDGETKGNTTSNSETYSLDELIKSNHLMENIMNIFDQKCFMQVW